MTIFTKQGKPIAQVGYILHDQKTYTPEEIKEALKWYETERKK